VSRLWVGAALGRGHYTRVTHADNRMRRVPGCKLEKLKHQLLSAEEKLSKNPLRHLVRMGYETQVRSRGLGYVEPDMSSGGNEKQADGKQHMTRRPRQIIDCRTAPFT